MYQMFYQYNNTLVIHWQTHMHARCASIMLGKMMKHSADTKLGTKLIGDMHAGLPFAFPMDTLDRSVSQLYEMHHSATSPPVIFHSKFNHSSPWTVTVFITNNTRS